MKSFARNRVGVALVTVACLVGAVGPSWAGERSVPETNGFSFVVAADMRVFTGEKYDTEKHFYGACEAIRQAGPGALLVSPGDIDQPWNSLETIRKVFGKEYPWIPVVGNHEIRKTKDMEWLREWGRTEVPKMVDIVSRGPEHGETTTYSFDYANAHFVVLNEYYDGKSDTAANGDIATPLYEWLKEDLEKNNKPFIFVFGHEPILAMPDCDSGTIRHRGDSLDGHPKNDHRFRALLAKHRVTAYICGHTHCFSYANINGVWQLDAGHARGFEKQTGGQALRSTFLKVRVGRERCRVDVYRAAPGGWPYALTRTIGLPDCTVASFPEKR